MAVKFANNAYTTLSSDINDSVETIPVADILKFPNLTLDGGGHHMYLTIVGSSATEIIKVSAAGPSEFTCVRGQDDTDAIEHDSGDRVELRVTTAMLQDAFSSSFTNITDGSNIIVADSTTDTLNITGTGGATVTNTPGTATITINAPAAGASKGFATAMAIAL